MPPPAARPLPEGKEDNTFHDLTITKVHGGVGPGPGGGGGDVNGSVIPDPNMYNGNRK